MAYVWIIRHESIEVNPKPYSFDEDKKNKGTELDAKNRMKKAPKDRAKFLIKF